MASPESEEEKMGVTPTSPGEAAPKVESPIPKCDGDVQPREDRIDPGMENGRSHWTISQLFYKKRKNPAWRNLTRIMRETSDQLDVSSIEAENYDKAVTQIMDHFAALRNRVEDRATREKVGKAMIVNYGRRQHYRQFVRNQSSSSLNVKKPGMEKAHEIVDTLKDIIDGAEAEEPGVNSSSWTVQQLLERKRFGNPAWLAVSSALRVTSEKYNVKSATSENYDKALTEAMKKFRAFKPLVTNQTIRKHLGDIMISNMESRTRKKEARKKLKSSSRRLLSPTSRLKPALSRADRKIAAMKGKKAPLGKMKKKRQKLKPVGGHRRLDSSVEKETEPEAHGNDSEEVDEEDDDVGSRLVPTKDGPARSLYQMLSEEARDLVFNHQPNTAWQRLKKMRRLSSDALGLVGLRQEKAYHAIKQILGSFPQLQPYVDDREVLRNFRQRMYSTLKNRIYTDRRRLAEFCLQTDDQAKTIPEKKQIWKQTSLVSAMKTITDISIMDGSSPSSDSDMAPSPPRKAPRKVTPPKEAPTDGGASSSTGAVDAALSCKDYHKGWTRQQIMSLDLRPKHRWAPPRRHFLRVMQEVSTQLNVIHRKDPNYELAITQVMSHFAALKRLVNVRKYRVVIGKRLRKNRQLREKRRRDQEAMGEDDSFTTPSKEPSQSKMETEEEGEQTDQTVATSNTDLGDLRGAAKGHKRKREPSLSELKASLMSTEVAQPKKTIRGYLQVRDSKQSSAGAGESKEEERQGPDGDVREGKQSELDAEDLDTSGESRCSEKGQHSKSGSRKSIEYYLVARKKAGEKVNPGSGTLEKKGITDKVDNDLEDGCSIHFEDIDDDDAFEDPPSLAPRNKRDGDGKDLECASVGEPGTVKEIKIKIKKRGPLKQGRKKSSFLVKVKGLCSKELDTSDEMKDSKVGDEEIKVFSDWTLTGDSEASEDVSGDARGAIRGADRERLEGEEDARREGRSGDDEQKTDDDDCPRQEKKSLEFTVDADREQLGAADQELGDDSSEANGSGTVSEQTDEVLYISTSSEEGMNAGEGENDDFLDVTGLAGGKVEKAHVDENQNQADMGSSAVADAKSQEGPCVETTKDPVGVGGGGNRQIQKWDVRSSLGTEKQMETIRTKMGEAKIRDAGHEEEEDVFMVVDSVNESSDDLPDVSLQPLGEVLPALREKLGDSGERSKLGGGVASGQMRDEQRRDHGTLKADSGNLKVTKKKKK